MHPLWNALIKVSVAFFKYGFCIFYIKHYVFVYYNVKF